ncbi:MAG: 4Fe-4S binding protein [Methanobacteriaceae archaeon]|nr:4Fe-4S binding protein [Methanobacteriaceae archaeon]
MKIDSDECALCDICLKFCPENAIIKKRFKIVITDDCTDCKKCLDICPVGAIHTE